MVSRLILLIFIYTIRGVLWFVEQPAGSLMEHHPKFIWLGTIVPIYRIRLKMGEFGAPTEKPTLLFSNNKAALNRILDYKTRKWNRAMKTHGLVSNYIDANGVKRVSGDMKNLKKSQAYPRGFGEAVAKVYEEFRGDMIKSARTLASDAEAVDVNLTEMFSLLAGVKQNTKVCSLDYGAFAHIALPRFVP